MSSPQFDLTGIGKWSDPVETAVTAEALAAYAAATNDPIEAHRRGDVAPPVYAIVPVFFALLPVTMNVVPIELIMNVVHGEQDFRFHRPITPGMQLVSRGKVTGLVGKSSGTVVTVCLESRTKDDGALVNEQWVTSFIRKVDAGQAVGEVAPGHAFDEALRAVAPVGKVVQHVDDDQTYRYSEASGDPMPIHLDDEFAKSVGLPGIIAHGLCTMAFTSHALLTELADGDPTRLKRLAVRFAKPVLPGQDITTRIWANGEADGAARYAYETTVGDEVVVKDGLAEIAR